MAPELLRVGAMVSAALEFRAAPANSPATPRELRVELSDLRNNQTLSAADLKEQLLSFRLRVAASFETWLGNRHQSADGELDHAVNLVFELSEIGANDFPIQDQAPVSETPIRANATIRTLRTIALVPAWQSGAVPLSEVPAWMLPLAAAYHFAGPTLLTTPGQSEAFAHDYLHAVNDLARLVQANRGSAGIRAAVDCYLRAPVISPAWAGALWPQISAARSRLVGGLFPQPKSVEPLVIPREGRRLRVGVVAESLKPEGAVASALSLVERLDPSRFELVVISPDLESPVAIQLSNRGADLVRLSVAPADALQSIQDALLDVILFIADPSRPEQLVHELARVRIAALQIWHDGLQEPCGSPAIDLVIAGASELMPRTPDTTSRWALLPGAGPCEINELRTQPETDVIRDEVGLAPDDFVLVSFAPLAAISPEMQVCWARILKRLPQARLLLCAGAGAAPDPRWLDRFCQHFESVLAAHGASSAQLLVFPDVLSTFEARKRVIALANVLLDCGTHSDAESAIAAAERGVPVVATNAGPRRGHRAAALLDLARLQELAGDSDAAYVPTVVRLAVDAEWRQEVVQKWVAASTTLLAFHDSFAQSAAFASAIDRAFDEIALSRDTFKSAADPITPPSPAEVELAIEEADRMFEIGLFIDASVRAQAALAGAPANPKPRHLIGLCFKALMKPGMAADWMLSQVDLAPPSAEAWYEIAVASGDAGREANSMAALQAALQVDCRHVDSWLYLGRCRDPIIREEVEKALLELAPDDARTNVLFAHWRQNPAAAQ